MSFFLPEEWIEEVRTKNDIIDVISEYLPLKPSGRGYFGLCPFHNEKTPSFHVNPELQIFKCFGCGVGGNVFTFMSSIEKVNFIESVKILAERVGMPLPDSTDKNKYAETKNLKEQIYELNREAARYYHDMLFSKMGDHALSYLKSRGLDLSTLRSFGLGFAPDGWENIKKFLLDKGFDEKLQLEAGIVAESRGRVNDRFRNRIIFPIIHPRGMVIGCGGRIMDDSMPKYLNSPSSPAFDKSKTLFGLNLARKLRPLSSIIVVEGYMDVITLNQFGFKNAVASLGTSLTYDQAKLLRRYAGEVYIGYDGDTAGQMATLRGLDILYNAGCKVKVIQFPKGMDPDEILRNYGPEYFNKLMDGALSLVDYKLEQLEKQYDLTSQEGKVSYATAAAKILTKVDNLLERDAHIQRLESLTGFKSRLLYQQIELLQGKKNQEGLNRNIVGNNRYTKDAGNRSLLISSHIKAERYLVSLMARNGSFAERIIKGMDELSFEDELHGELAGIIAQLLDKGLEVNPAQILNYIVDQKKIEKSIEIFDLEIAYANIDRLISDCLGELTRYNLEKQRQCLQMKINEIEQGKQVAPDEYRLLLEKMEQLNRRIRMGK